MLCVYRILLVFVLLFPECEWMKNAYITRDKYMKILVTLVSLVINYIQVKFLYHRKAGKHAVDGANRALNLGPKSGTSTVYCQVQIPEAESCRCSEAESCERSQLLVVGIQGLLESPGNLWIFNAQICILPHWRLLSLISYI